jgi:hypothetical protein
MTLLFVSSPLLSFLMASTLAGARAAMRSLRLGSEAKVLVKVVGVHLENVLAPRQLTSTAFLNSYIA